MVPLFFLLRYPAPRDAVKLVVSGQLTEDAPRRRFVLPSSVMDRQEITGFLMAIGAFGLWGLTPLYWAPIRTIGSFELVLHRIAWTSVIAWIALLSSKGAIRSLLADRRTMLRSVVAGLIILINWLIYTYAITKGRALQASLGYYINPLFSVFLGMVFLGERLKRLQVAALVSAAAGVIYLTVEQGALPWVSVVLPFFFGLYGLMKKKTKLRPLIGLAVETSISGPVAMVWIAVQLCNGEWSLVYGGWTTSILLVGSGFMTTAPLVLFAGAAQRIALASVGFMQYIAPTMILVFGTTVLGEPFPLARLPGFLLVWIGLGLYTAAAIRGQRPTVKTASNL